MFQRRSKSTYLDYASYTPRDERLFSMNKIRVSGNASAYHKEGVEARSHLEASREKVSNSIGCHPDEIIFTSGGTEGDNIALLGAVESYENNIKKEKKEYIKPNIIISSIEHSAVIETVKYLEANGRAQVSCIPVGKNGIIDLDIFKELLKENTILVSVMYVNNEIGTIQPIHEVAKIIRDFKKTIGVNTKYPLLFVDACQAPNYLPINVEKLHPDLLVLNGAKIYAGSGAGALFVRRGAPIQSVMHGGSQELGLRPGTENIQAAHDFAVALDYSVSKIEKESKRLEILRQDFLAGLQDIVDGFKIESVLLGDLENSIPGIVNIAFPKFSSELLVIELDAKGIAVSSKSACKSDSPEESHVVKALGLGLPSEAGSVRFSFGRWTTKSDVQKTLDALRKIFLKYKK